jgi:hypothetical protein
MFKPPKNPGRPRVYESASEKISAFRRRQEQAGFMRKEVLVTQATVERVRVLAEQYGVKPTDVYSALLEHGLDLYEPTVMARDQPSTVEPEPIKSMEGNPFTRARKAALAAEAARSGNATLSTDSVAKPELPAITGPSPASDDPIKRFFAKRKERQHEQK